MTAPLPKASAEDVRFATFNAFLNRFSEGQLAADLADPDDQLGAGGADTQARAVAEIIQRTRPDVLLLNEFDTDLSGTAISRFQQNFLGQSQSGQAPIHYPHVYLAASNTGLLAEVDLDGDGQIALPDDGYGFGFFPGQFGMVLLSRYPIARHRVRTFREFRWQDMPDNLIPEGFYSEQALEAFRLSSKSHWDVPLRIQGRTVHVLAAHPTPPVFDDPVFDQNGRRNHDEIRFWTDYVGPRRGARYIRDDRGRRGGLRGSRAFVIVGDYNADPFDGDSTNGAALQFFTSPAIDTSVAPASFGGAEDALIEGNANVFHQGNPALDTADFNPAAPGNLRVDYVLPSKAGLEPICGGVFWPASSDTTRPLVGSGFPVVSSDHHLVWLDVRIDGARGGAGHGDAEDGAEEEDD